MQTARATHGVAPTIFNTCRRLASNLQVLSGRLFFSQYVAFAANCLNNANITTVGELAMKTEQEMLKYRNFGKKSLNEIKDKLEALGLSLGMKFDERLLETKKET